MYHKKAIVMIVDRHSVEDLNGLPYFGENNEEISDSPRVIYSSAHRFAYGRQIPIAQGL